MSNNDANSRQVGGSHYGGHKFQHWDWVEWNGMGYQEAQISLYVLRWKAKGGIQDLDKAIHHTQKLIEQYHDTQIMRRNRRNRYGNDHRTYELLNNMQTPPNEGLVCIKLLTWYDTHDLDDIIMRIEAIKNEAPHA